MKKTTKTPTQKTDLLEYVLQRIDREDKARARSYARQEQRSDQLYHMFAQMLPSIMAMFGARYGGGAGAHGAAQLKMQSMVSALLSSITPEQSNQMKYILLPSQVEAIHEILGLIGFTLTPETVKDQRD